MKRFWQGLAVMTLVATTVQAQTPLGATDITAAEVRQFIAQLPRDEATDRPIRVVDLGGYRLGVYGVFRPASAPDNSSLHETKVAEIYYILEGSGTLVTGGTLREPVRRRKSATSAMINVNSDNGIEGGVNRKVSKGDMVIIPARVAHWWSAREGDMTYLIIRPDPDNELTLK